MNARETIHHLFDAWNNRDWDTIRSLLHPEYIYTGPDGQEASGIEDGLTVGWKEHADGLPDGRVELNALYGDGDVVVTEFTVRGTHNGTWLGIAPTGKSVEVDLCNIIEFRDGKAIRERDYLDTLGVFVQLGAVQMPSP